jgi:diphosphomevalonate decarboxylase
VTAIAIAHPNVALVKYWGKRGGDDNLPATPSLSLTLGGLTTRTAVTLEPNGDGAAVTINGATRRDAKIDACIARLRARAPQRCGRLVVASDNDFPTAAGLASSASGFAALVAAIDAELGLELDFAARADQTRRGSASAARSMLGGIVAFDGNDDPASWQPRQLHDEHAWALAVIVAVCYESPKSLSSGDAMARTKGSSPYYDRWLGCARDDFAHASKRIMERDFDGLADLAEGNCLAMHAAMLSARPAIVYWNAATVECIHRIRALRAKGTPAFFTIDAGPQVKAVCVPEARAAVHAALADAPGVRRVIESGLGAGVTVEPRA